MAYSLVNKVATGSSNTFTVNFALDYINIDDVTAWVTGEVDGLGAKVYRTITPVTTNILTLSGAMIGAGLVVVFTRTVDKDTLVVDWEDDKLINEETLNLAQKQALMLVHEVLDGRFAAFQSDIDLGGFVIHNSGDATLAGDLVNKKLLDAAVMASGNFILPGAGNNSRVPAALSSTTYGWRQLATTDLSDAATQIGFPRNQNVRVVSVTPDAPSTADIGYLLAVTVNTAVINLPAVSGFIGKQLVIKAYNATGNVTVNRNGTDTFTSGLASITIPKGGWVRLVGETGVWRIIDGFMYGGNFTMDIAGNFTLNTASGTEYQVGTSTKVLPVNSVWAAVNAFTALTDAATIAVDLSTGINFSLLMTGAVGATRALGAPTNVKPGQTGVIKVTQDASGSRALTYNAVFKHAFGTPFVLSTAANAVDYLFYWVDPNGNIIITGILKAVA